MAHHSSSSSPAFMLVGGGKVVVVRAALIVVAICMLIYVVGVTLARPSSIGGSQPVVIGGSSGPVAGGGGSSSSCPPCVCDDICSPQPFGIAITNLFECGGNATTETEESLTNLLLEELKLQEVVVLDKKQQSARSLREAKKMSLHYQREAQKCSIGVEACEGARERAESTLLSEGKLTLLWEKRARELGWTEEEENEVGNRKE